MKKCNVLLITPCNSIGGEELSTLSLVKELKRRGYNVYILLGSNKMLEEFKDSATEVVVNPVVGSRNIRGVIQGAFLIRKLLKKYHIQIVHSQSVIPTIMGYLAAKGNANKKVKVILHERGIKHYKLVKRLNFIANFIIANSKYEMEKLIKTGFPSKKLTFIHNCYNLPYPKKSEKDRALLAEFHIQDNDFVVGAVGRLVPQKGFEYLLEAAKTVLKKIPNTKFILVGGGELESKLKNFSRTLKIDKNVIFTGPRRDMDKIYSIINIFTLPSLWEPFGNVSLEAMTFGKPVIASEVGGIPEVVEDGVTGILIPPKDSVKLAEVIIYLLKNPEVAKKMREAGRKRVQKYFTPERVGDEVEKVYEHLVS
ncbi:glycosyltransferase family 4 protein [Patescibacteria group bacterium]|nr:glycosyltransferase family 4 protein [Patescibacteria group bacterium]